jgi:3-phenylpropionate/trans-cinnamate dioxygenase ferredoxin subunit
MAGAFARVAKISDVPPGTRKVAEAGGGSVLICHTNGRFYAVSNICSHANEKLECGRLGRTWIACPLHGARFELATGRAMNPPAVRPIATFEVRLVEDWIEILL